MNRIVILLQGRTWNAQFVGPHSAEIIELFGTDTIPTPFTSLTPVAEVVAEVRRRNPGVLVGKRTVVTA